MPPIRPTPRSRSFSTTIPPMSRARPRAGWRRSPLAASPSHSRRRMGHGSISLRASSPSEQLEKFNEFAAAVAFLDEGVNVTGEQIDTGHQGQGAVAFVLVITHHGWAGAGQRRAIRRGRTDRLDPGLLVVRDDGEVPAGAVLALGVLPFRPQHRHLPVDT